MRRAVTALLLLVLAPVTFAQTKPPPRRPITLADIWKVRRPGPPSVSPDGKWAVVELTRFDMEKNDSSSDLWLLSTDGRTQRQLTSAPGRSSSPRWSPDGKWIAFLAKRTGDEVNQIHVIPPDGGEARRVSSMPMPPSALRWSRDGRTIFCVGWTWPDTPDDDSHRKKDRAQKDDKVKAFVIDDALFRYWDRWLADGRRPVLFAVDLATGKHRNLFARTGIHLPPFDPSASSYDVSPDGSQVCFVADSLKKPGLDNNPDLFTLQLDGKSKPRNLTTDNAGSDSSPIYSPDGTWIAFLRSTTRHFGTDSTRLALFHRATGKIRTLTAGLDRSCTSPRWLPGSKKILCDVEDRGFVPLVEVDLDGNLTWFNDGFSDGPADVASKTGTVVFLRTGFSLPPAVYARHPGEKKARPLEYFNDPLRVRWKLGKVDSVTFKGADDEDVQMWVVLPPDFDPRKKWPLVQVVHGGPHVGITSGFHFRWNLHLWAAQGYVVGCVNFHGSSGFGRKFADSITGDLGTKPGIDILKATDWFEKQPWIDGKRLAAAGASYGGFMMAWLNGHTDRFKAMVCHAGVYSYHGQMASDVVYSRERALGAFPWNDLEKVDRQSAQRYARNFKTPTIVLHGERDFRVPIQHGLEYYVTLKLKGIPARLVYFPDENHWILKPQNSRLWHREVFAWLEKYVGSGPRP